MGRRAQELLRFDMDKGVHDALKPFKFHTTRPEYEEFLLPTFRDHIYQEQRLRKYQNYLLQKELEDEQKLLNKGKKKAKTKAKKKAVGMGDVEVVVDEEENGDLE